MVTADIDVSPSCISGLSNGNRPITADKELRLGLFFNMAPRFWMNLQIESMPCSTLAVIAGCSARYGVQFRQGRFMENTKSPFDTLFGESLPRVLQAMDEYHALAVPHCAPEHIQLLGELQRRVKQCEFLLRNAGAIEQRQLAFSMNVLAAVAGRHPDADQHFEASCQDIDAMWLLSESFYWVAHKAILLIMGKPKCFNGRRLPKMPAKFPNGGAANVRNHFIEHPFEYNNQFGLGGMWRGPVLNGGLGKDQSGNVIEDPGLYFNAIEWADAASTILRRASEELRNEA